MKITLELLELCLPKQTDVPHVTQIEDVSRETSEYMIIEVTPYRIETKYTDFRHPDEVIFSDKLEDDLKRRDFTVNAMALDLPTLKLWQASIKDKIKDIL